jgi:hypothetical protein
VYRKSHLLDFVTDRVSANYAAVQIERWNGHTPCRSDGELSTIFPSRDPSASSLGGPRPSAIADDRKATETVTCQADLIP